MSITIAIQVHNFQHRLSWMLSSLAHQIGGPDITVDVSCVAGNGNPTTDEICALYNDKLDIRITEYELDTLQYRGLTRNGAILRCDTAWLLFADCDMVYHPTFFARLMEHIDSVDDDQLGSVFISGRYSNDIDLGNKLVMAEDYAKAIDNPWKRCDRRLNKIGKNCVGAGYFQLINLDHCEHFSYYVDANKNKDKSWLRHFAKASSDYQFRRRIDKTHKLPRWFWQNQIHINHERDNGNGLRAPRHLDEQR